MGDIREKAEALIKITLEAYSRYLAAENKSAGENGRVCGYQEIISTTEFNDLKAALRPSREEIARVLEGNLPFMSVAESTKKYIQLAIEELRNERD